jgi:putative membrane protein
VRSGPAEPRPAGQARDDQYERTVLAWRRTALALVATGLLVAQLSAGGLGPAALLVTLIGAAAAVGVVSRSDERKVGAAGLVLVLGVLVLGAVALTGVAGVLT